MWPPPELCRCRDPGDEAASSHWNHHHVDVWDLLEQLEPDCPLSGHDGQIVEWMDQPEVSLPLQGQACVEHTAFSLDDLATVASCRLDL
jgi:hypothetical protein